MKSKTTTNSFTSSNLRNRLANQMTIHTWHFPVPGVSSSKLTVLVATPAIHNAICGHNQLVSIADCYLEWNQHTMRGAFYGRSTQKRLWNTNRTRPLV